MGELSGRHYPCRPSSLIAACKRPCRRSACSTGKVCRPGHVNGRQVPGCPEWRVQYVEKAIASWRAWHDARDGVEVETMNGTCFEGINSMTLKWFFCISIC